MQRRVSFASRGPGGNLLVDDSLGQPPPQQDPPQEDAHQPPDEELDESAILQYMISQRYRPTRDYTQPSTSDSTSPSPSSSPSSSPNAVRVLNVDSLLANLEAQYTQDSSTDTQLLQEAPSIHLSGMVHKSAQADARVGRIDYCARLGLVAACTGTAIVLWNAESMQKIGQLGRLGGGIHRDNVLSCTFSRTGRYLVSCGADGKVVIWETESRQTVTSLSGHRDMVLSAMFARRGALLYTCGADGKVLTWDLELAELDQDAMQHSSTVRCIAYSPVNKMLVCGCNDGSVAIWDGQDHVRVGTIDAHDGAVCALAFADSGRQLATASWDGTCKLWDVVSFFKDAQSVRITQQWNERAQERASRSSSAYVRIGGDADDDDDKDNDAEVQVDPGYHGDVEYVLRHDGPCVDLLYAQGGQFLVTASMDATVRVWSVLNGELVFQINTPSAVTGVSWDEASGRVICACEDRVLVIALAEAGAFDDTLAIVHPSVKQGQRAVSAGALQRTLAHGALAPQFLSELASRLQRVNEPRLRLNMHLFRVSQSDIVRVLATSGYRAADVLEALARPGDEAAPMFRAIDMGKHIGSFMQDLGYKQAGRGEDGEVVIVEGADRDDLFCYEVEWSRSSSQSQGLSPRTGGKGRGEVVKWSPAEQLRLRREVRRNHRVSSPIRERLLDSQRVPGFRLDEAEDGENPEDRDLETPQYDRMNGNPQTSTRQPRVDTRVRKSGVPMNSRKVVLKDMIGHEDDDDDASVLLDVRRMKVPADQDDDADDQVRPANAYGSGFGLAGVKDRISPGRKRNKGAYPWADGVGMVSGMNVTWTGPSTTHTSSSSSSSSLDSQSPSPSPSPDVTYESLVWSVDQDGEKQLQGVGDPKTADS